jgi:uncharacterized cupin superfamily protein
MMADTDDNGCGAIRFDRMSWESIKPGFQLKTAEAGGKTLRMGSYGAGYVGDFWCEDGHIGFVYEGRLTIRFDNDEQHYKAGDAFCIPAGRATRHKVSQPLGQAAVVFITSAE